MRQDLAETYQEPCDGNHHDSCHQDDHKVFMLPKREDSSWTQRRMNMLEILLLQYSFKIKEEWLRWRAFKDLGELEGQRECVENVQKFKKLKLGWERELSDIYKKL